MSIHSNYFPDQRGHSRRIDAGTIMWVVGSALVFVGVSPMVAIYLLLVG